MKNDLIKGPFDIIVRHEYLARKGNPFMLLLNVKSLEDLEAFMLTLDMGEKLCTFDEDKYRRLLPVFKEIYPAIGDVKEEVKFINEQRQLELKRK